MRPKLTTDDLVIFCERTGRLPSNFTGVTELENQLQTFMCNHPRDPVVKSLRTRFFNKTIVDLIAEVRGFCESHGRLPSMYFKDEQSLYQRIIGQLKKRNPNPIILELYHGFPSFEESHPESINTLTAFCEKYDRFPTKCDDESEVSLYSWAWRNRKNKEVQRLMIKYPNSK